MDPSMQNTEGVELLQHIREGMTVLDMAGEEVGTVEYVQFADPEAVTTEADRLGGRLTEPGLPLTNALDPDDSGATERMRQSGYIRIDAKGWFTGSKHVGAESIGGVEGDTVRLSLAKDDI